MPVALWTEQGSVRGSFFQNGECIIKSLAEAKYTGFAKQPIEDEGIISIEPDFPGWYKLSFADYDTRKAVLSRHEHEIYEGDVSPIRRYISDNDVAIEAPRRAYLDLETDSRVPFSSAVLGGSRLLSWAVVAEDGSQFTGVLEDDADKAEAELWASLWTRMGDFDQLACWNGDSFDFEVTKYRCLDLAKRFSKVMQPYWEHRRRLLFVDHLACFKRHHMSMESGGDKTSMKLDSVCEAIIGEKKHDFNSAKTWDSWAAGGAERQRLVQYNAQDSALLVKLEKATGYLQLQQTLNELTHTFGNSQGLKPLGQVDGYLLRLAHLRETHLPSKKQPTGDEEQFEGAFVLPPQSLGIHRTVHCVDFKSLYPTVIRTFNISPETKGVGIEPSTAFRTGVTFDNVIEGMVPQACRESMELREHWKQEYKRNPDNKDAERKSKAYKIFCNSIYGVLGCIWSRFFDPQLAESVTLGAKELNDVTANAVRERGWNVLYQDSITPERPVIVRDPAGNVQIIRVERLWNMVSGDIDTLRDKEYMIPIGWQALTEQGWKPLERIIRHHVTKPVYTITTKHGQVRVTEDHSVMCNGVETKPQDFVDRNLRFTTVQAPKEHPVEVVDLMDYVSSFRFSFIAKGFRYTRKFIAYGEDHIVLNGWGKFTDIRIKRFYKRGTSEFASLLRLIGAYASDGSASLRSEGACRNLLSFCKANLELMNVLAKDLSTIFEGGEVYGPYWTDTVYVVRSGTTAMSCLFAALCGTKCVGKRLPPFVLKLDDAGFAEFYQSLALGDGYVEPETGQLNFTSKSPELIAGVSYLLSQQNIEHGWHYRQGKSAWTLRTRPAGSERHRYSIKHAVEPNYEGYVYDLSVEGAHTFVDGIGRVLLHNTDSSLFTGCTVEECKAFVEWCNADLYPRLLDTQGCPRDQQCIALDYEKAFDRLIFPLGNNGKPCSKRYAGSFLHYAFKPKTKPEIRGLEYMRSDATKYTRCMQKELIGILLAPEEPTPDALMEWVKRQRELFFDAVLSAEDISKSAGISQALAAYKTSPPHVRIAREMEAAGEDISEGTRVGYIVVDGRVSPKKVINVKDFDGKTFDRHFYWNRSVYPACMRVLCGAFPGHPWSRWIAKYPKPILPGQLALSF